ncbi:unnamed protein product [Amaranthus hypochondriacus]
MGIPANTVTHNNNRVKGTKGGYHTCPLNPRNKRSIEALCKQHTIRGAKGGYQQPHRWSKRNIENLMKRAIRRAKMQKQKKRRSQETKATVTTNSKRCPLLVLPVGKGFQVKGFCEPADGAEPVYRKTTLTGSSKRAVDDEP